MNIFGKKKEEEFEDEEEELAKSIPSKKFKDLNPQNKKKRKEPIRPWGRKERLTILIVLLTTVFASGFLGLGAREWKWPGLPNLDLETPSLNLFKEETIVIGGNAPSKNSKNAETIDLFKKATQSLSGVYAFYVIEPESDNSYGTNEKNVMEAASLIKLPIFIALYKDAEKGTIDLDAKYTLKEGDKSGGSGSLVDKKAGTQITYRQMAELMGQQSDNTAFNVIRKTLGDDKINQVIDEIGMSATSLENNETSAYDVGILFNKLYKGELVSHESSEEILGYLTDTVYEEHLGAGIPSEVRVAHKYGREIHVVNDAGVVFSDKPFVVVIMTKGVVEKEADEIFSRLAKLIYDQETGLH